MRPTVEVAGVAHAVRPLAELSPREKLPVLKALTLFAEVDGTLGKGKGWLELRPKQEEGFRLFIAALVPAVDPAILAAMDFDALYTIAARIAVVERGE